MTILLFGANGQVGHACIVEAQKRGVKLNSLARTEADFSQPNLLNDIILKYKPTLVINAAAYTAVDRAENEEEFASKVNAQAPMIIAQACQSLSIPLIHISTDYVFDGNSSNPYTEKDTTNPANAYGRTKLAGERAIIQYCTRHIIIRTSWIFSSHGNNFVKTMLNLSTKKELSIVSDQQGSPTYAGYIAELILNITAHYLSAKTVPWGVYNFCGTPATTWYKFAHQIFDSSIKLNIITNAPVLKPISTENYPTPATRPLKTILSQEKILSVFALPNADWAKGLDTTLKLLSE